MTGPTVRVFDDLSGIDPLQWNALVEAQPSATPFMRHEYLLALRDSGSATPATGWATNVVALDRRPARRAAGCVSAVCEDPLLW